MHIRRLDGRICVKRGIGNDLCEELGVGSPSTCLSTRLELVPQRAYVLALVVARRELAARVALRVCFVIRSSGVHRPRIPMHSVTRRVCLDGVVVAEDTIRVDSEAAAAEERREPMGANARAVVSGMTSAGNPLGPQDVDMIRTVGMYADELFNTPRSKRHTAAQLSQDPSRAFEKLHALLGQDALQSLPVHEARLGRSLHESIVCQYIMGCVYNGEVDAKDGDLITKSRERQMFHDAYVCDRCSCAGKVKRCARCFNAKYCSKDCQKAHWKVHRIHCQSSACQPCS